MQRRGAASGARGRPSVERGRVLLVDDEEVLLVALSGYLRRFGWSVRTASTGPAALTAIDAERFDAIVVDLRMPGMSGVELCRVIKRERATEALVIATSGFVTPENMLTLRELGIADVMTKPVSPDVLVERLNAAARGA